MPSGKPRHPKRLDRALASARPQRSIITPAQPPKQAAAKLVIRQAIFTDSVNIYKGLTADEQQRRIRTQNDEVARSAFILATIAKGFVVVVEVAGRILGAIGFTAGGPEYSVKTTLTASFAFLTPSFRRPEIISRIVGKVNEFADLHKVDVEIVVDSEVAEFWEEQDYAQTGVRLVRQYVEERVEEDEDLNFPDDTDEGDDDDFEELEPTGTQADSVHGAGGTAERDDVGSELVDDEP